jgi:hypothetical protein
MVGSRGARVKVALLSVCALVASCAGRAEQRQAETHVDLLVAMAHKGADLVANGRFTAESMPELTYPLERAQLYAEAARRHGRLAPAALDTFAQLLERYRDFVDTLDRVRREQRGQAAATALAEPLTRVDDAAATARAALRPSAGAG